MSQSGRAALVLRRADHLRKSFGKSAGFYSCVFNWNSEIDIPLAAPPVGV